MLGIGHNPPDARTRTLLTPTFQHPLDQTAGTEQRKELQLLFGQTVALDIFAEVLDQFGLLIDGRFQSASVLEQLVAEAMSGRSCCVINVSKVAPVKVGRGLG